MSVAVVIAVRNMADTLGRAIASASDAEEIHVVDDASTDGITAVMADAPSNVLYWRWPLKSRSHTAALRTVYHASVCKQFIGLGADDYLKPGLINAVRSNADAPVIFSDYDVVDPSGELLSVIPQGVTDATRLTPGEMRTRIQSPRNATETGIGSSLRSDVADWLWERQWDRLGPHMDSIGYASAAATFGCLLLPMVGAAYTHGRQSYGRDSTKSHEDFIRWGKVCREWVYRTAGMDDATTRALCRKRCFVEW